jgi:hypothetical protein
LAHRVTSEIVFLHELKGCLLCQLCALLHFLIVIDESFSRRLMIPVCKHAALCKPFWVTSPLPELPEAPNLLFDGPNSSRWRSFRPPPPAQHSRTNPFVTVPASPNCGILGLQCVSYRRFITLGPPSLHALSPRSFEDPDGLLAKGLLATKKLYEFGDCTAIKR